MRPSANVMEDPDGAPSPDIEYIYCSLKERERKRERESCFCIVNSEIFSAKFPCYLARCSFKLKNFILNASTFTVSRPLKTCKKTFLASRTSYKLRLKKNHMCKYAITHDTLCRRSLDPFYIVIYYTKL